jgi:hypothetical protein
MADLMLEALQATSRPEGEAQLRARIAEPVFELAGRPTMPTSKLGASRLSGSVCPVRWSS